MIGLALGLSEPEAKYQRPTGTDREISVNSKWPKLMLMSGATSAWPIYDMTTATEAPRQAVAVLQYGLLTCASFGLVGSLVMFASKK
jgi:hypothetical protein